MYCHKCGAENEDNAYRCRECGAELNPGGGASAAPNVPNYLVQSILVTVLCCLPFGIPAIIFASQANSRKAAGDYAGGLEAANKAKLWCWVSFGVGVFITIIYLALAVIGALAELEGY